jgi:hypothetical protein
MLFRFLHYFDAGQAKRVYTANIIIFEESKIVRKT